MKTLTQSRLILPAWLPPIYQEFVDGWRDLSDSELRESLRYWLRTDLWFFLRFALNRKDMDHPWLYARCKEIQDRPDGCLDLWARDHRKSSIITFAKTLQDILASHGDDPLPEWKGMEPTFGIFSHTRPIAKAFLRQIKTECEQNEPLRELFPDVMYERPDRESPRWSEDNGLVFRRRSNPKEATVEAWGLIDGQPTGKHFNVLIYDDVVTRDSVTSPEMIQKTTEAWEQSLNLGDSEPRKRMIGTRWHFADTYRSIMERGAAAPRLHPATDDGTLKGKPVLLTEKQLADKIRDMGPYTASAQLLLNPTVDSKQSFKREWLDHRFDQNAINWRPMTRVLLCDPANAKKKTSDYTTMAVIGLGEDRKYYLLDYLRDRLTLVERTAELFRLHRKWKPHRVGYEQYGKDSDIQHIQTKMDNPPYHFDIEEVAGKLSKVDRINRLIPVCSAGDLWLPEVIFRTNYEGKVEELVLQLIEQEFLPWPVPVHDDGLDVIARVFDMEGLEFPEPEVEPHKDDRYSRKSRRAGSWMGA